MDEHPLVAFLDNALPCGNKSQNITHCVCDALRFPSVEAFIHTVSAVLASPTAQAVLAARLALTDDIWIPLPARALLTTRPRVIGRVRPLVFFFLARWFLFVTVRCTPAYASTLAVTHKWGTLEAEHLRFFKTPGAFSDERKLRQALTDFACLNAPKYTFNISKVTREIITTNVTAAEVEALPEEYLLMLSFMLRTFYLTGYMHSRADACTFLLWFAAIPPALAVWLRDDIRSNEPPKRVAPVLAPASARARASGASRRPRARAGSRPTGGADAPAAPHTYETRWKEVFPSLPARTRALVFAFIHMFPQYYGIFHVPLPRVAVERQVEVFMHKCLPMQASLITLCPSSPAVLTCFIPDVGAAREPAAPESVVKRVTSKSCGQTNTAIGLDTLMRTGDVLLSCFCAKKRTRHPRASNVAPPRATQVLDWRLCKRVPAIHFYLLGAALFFRGRMFQLCPRCVRIVDCTSLLDTMSAWCCELCRRTRVRTSPRACEHCNDKKRVENVTCADVPAIALCVACRRAWITQSATLWTRAQIISGLQADMASYIAPSGVVAVKATE